MMKYTAYCTWVVKGHFFVDAENEKEAFKIAKEFSEEPALRDGGPGITQGDYVGHSLIITDVVKETKNHESH